MIVTMSFTNTVYFSKSQQEEWWTMQGTEGLVQLRAVCPSEFIERQEAPGSGGGDKGV